MHKGVSTSEKTPTKDESSSIFVNAVLIPSVLIVGLPVALH